jgi:hypothetical protein
MGLITGKLKSFMQQTVPVGGTFYWLKATGNWRMSFTWKYMTPIWAETVTRVFLKISLKARTVIT